MMSVIGGIARARHEMVNWLLNVLQHANFLTELSQSVRLQQLSNGIKFYLVPWDTYETYGLVNHNLYDVDTIKVMCTMSTQYVFYNVHSM